jgi:chromosome segregation ATPase
MATTPENAMTPSTPPERGRTPAWIWLLILVLIGFAGYAGYMAISKHTEAFDVERARQALARDKTQLQQKMTDLEARAAQADKAKTAAEHALKQSRADTETASTQIKDLQGQVAALNDKIKALQGEAEDAEKRAKAATQAKDKLAKEVEDLRGRLSEIQTKLDSAVSDLTSAQEQSKTTEPEQPAAP